MNLNAPKGLTMKLNLAALSATLLLALAAATAASAATIDQLPGLGYSVSMVTQLDGCHAYTATGYGATGNFGTDCDATFQQNLDTFVAGHDERKLGYQHPAAVGARADLQGKGYAVSTDYAVPTFHVTGGCNIDSTGDASSIVTIDAALPVAAPCPPPPPVTTTTSTTTTAPAGGGATTTETVATVPVNTTPECDLACINARVTALENRVTAIEQANTAAWSAFRAALLDGATPAEAALAARSAGENAIYQLGGV